MRIYVMYDRDTSWQKHQLDTDLMLFRSPNNNWMFEIGGLEDLSSIIEQGLTIYVLREPMELGTGARLEDVEFNIDFIINSSKILFVEPRDEGWRPMDREEPPVTVDQYLSEEEKKKRKKKMEHIGKPR